MFKHLPKMDATITIDYHDISHYENKNDLNVRGTKRKNGTNYCHQYAMLEIVNGKRKFTLAIKKLSVNDNEKSLVIKDYKNHKIPNSITTM